MFAVLLCLLSLLHAPTIVVSLFIDPAQSIPAQLSNTSQSQLPDGSLPALPIAPIIRLPSNLSALLLQCDAPKYGHDLKYSSCHDAYSQIPHLIDLISFGPRTQGNWAVRLPFRVYSCEWR